MNSVLPSPQGLDHARRLIDAFFLDRAEFSCCRDSFLQAFDALLDAFARNGTLFLCGNGGSYADCLHIGGELLKTFERKRPLPPALADAFRRDLSGEVLAAELQSGFRAVPLGLNPSLVSAILNDSNQPDLQFAQELYVMARPGDLLLALSTSGGARNVLHAMTVARVLGMRTIALTGPEGGEVARRAEIPVRVPGDSRTCRVQESHLACYHTLCLAVEAAFFPEAR